MGSPRIVDTPPVISSEAESLVPAALPFLVRRQIQSLNNLETSGAALPPVLREIAARRAKGDHDGIANIAVEIQKNVGDCNLTRCVADALLLYTGFPPGREPTGIVRESKDVGDALNNMMSEIERFLLRQKECLTNVQALFVIGVIAETDRACASTTKFHEQVERCRSYCIAELLNGTLKFDVARALLLNPALPTLSRDDYLQIVCAGTSKIDPFDQLLVAQSALSAFPDLANAIKFQDGVRNRRLKAMGDLKRIIEDSHATKRSIADVLEVLADPRFPAVGKVESGALVTALRRKGSVELIHPGMSTGFSELLVRGVEEIVMSAFGGVPDHREREFFRHVLVNASGAAQIQSRLFNELENRAEACLKDPDDEEASLSWDFLLDQLSFSCYVEDVRTVSSHSNQLEKSCCLVNSDALLPTAKMTAVPRLRFLLSPIARPIAEERALVGRLDDALSLAEPKVLNAVQRRAIEAALEPFRFLSLHSVEAAGLVAAMCTKLTATFFAQCNHWSESSVRDFATLVSSHYSNVTPDLRNEIQRTFLEQAARIRTAATLSELGAAEEAAGRTVLFLGNVDDAENAELFAALVQSPFPVRLVQGLDGRLLGRILGRAATAESQFAPLISLAVDWVRRVESAGISKPGTHMIFREIEGLLNVCFETCRYPLSNDLVTILKGEAERVKDVELKARLNSLVFTVERRSQYLSAAAKLKENPI